MVADLVEATVGEVLSVSVVRLQRDAAEICVETQILVARIRLRMLRMPGGDFILVYQDRVGGLIDPRGELGERLAASRHPCPAVIAPTMDAAHKTIAVDTCIGEQHTAMQTAAIEDRDFVACSQDHQVDSRDQPVCRLAVFEFSPAFPPGSWLMTVDGGKPFMQSVNPIVMEAIDTEFAFDVILEGDQLQNAILGRVVDEAGQPVEGANVSAFGGVIVRARSWSDGSFVLTPYLNEGQPLPEDPVFAYVSFRDYEYEDQGQLGPFQWGDRAPRSDVSE